MSKDFFYKMNAMESAAHTENPAAAGYAAKRRAVFDYVEGLEAIAHIKPHITIGNYSIHKTQYGYWIEHESGEGMEVKHEIMERAIEEFYKAHF